MSYARPSLTRIKRLSLSSLVVGLSVVQTVCISLHSCYSFSLFWTKAFQFMGFLVLDPFTILSRNASTKRRCSASSTVLWQAIALLFFPLIILQLVPDPTSRASIRMSVRPVASIFVPISQITLMSTEMVSKRLVIAKNVKINGTWERHSPKHQWTTFWMETLNKSVV